MRVQRRPTLVMVQGCAAILDMTHRVEHSRGFRLELKGCGKFQKGVLQVVQRDAPLYIGRACAMGMGVNQTRHEDLGAVPSYILLRIPPVQVFIRADLPNRILTN